VWSMDSRGAHSYTSGWHSYQTIGAHQVRGWKSSTWRESLGYTNKTARSILKLLKYRNSSDSRIDPFEFFMSFFIVQ
jgi:hypothetical protein